MSRRTFTLATAGFLLVSLLAVALVLPVPYVTMRPGPTVDVLGDYEDAPVLEIDESVETYPTEGELRLTTVSVTRADARLTLPEAFWAYFDDDEAVVPRDLIYPPGQTAEESREQNTAQMEGSKLDSEAVALRAAGYDVQQVVVVGAVEEGSPSDGVLRPGDVVLAVDGTGVEAPGDVVDLVGAQAPGDSIRLRIRRDGETSTETVVAGEQPDDPDKARIGITLGTDVDLPFDVTNTIGDTIGGPSAGLIFALGLYDELTPGPLTGGQTVAGTGTIDLEGSVGPIGGIQQKIAGAVDEGASVFLVPAANCDEAAALDDPGAVLVEVATFDDAVDALGVLADDPDGTVPTCR
ncbi:PDZ domain-containing protein [Mumia flava]|uniref:endopeptidase La n=1 Tax=Mumia flava TaxID=1348852 RepID=A0A0B2BK12_9ACTN|nr:PDZ domain-containing protein [Mumia flava]PJJ56631.1 PDZ domain-containing protein [Mumia flava]